MFKNTSRSYSILQLAALLSSDLQILTFVRYKKDILAPETKVVHLSPFTLFFK